MGKGIVEELKKEYEINDIWYGLEIHPETPPQGMNLVERFGKDNLEANKKKLNQMGEPFGLKFGALNNMPNSKKALLAAEYARTQGKFHEYHNALMYRYFTEDMNIGDSKILIKLGNDIGLDTSEMEKSISTDILSDSLKSTNDLAHSKNIKSTPTFIINDEHIISGIQSLEKFKEVLNEVQPKTL